MSNVSVVAAVHNGLAYTRPFTDSLLRHAAAGAEIILIDNGTDDGTAGVLASLSGVRIIRNDSNLGLAAAWNQGVRAAGGSVVCICHNDVVLPAAWHARLVQELTTHPGAAVVCAEDEHLMGLATHLFGRELNALGARVDADAGGVDAMYPGGFDAFASAFQERHQRLRLVKTSSGCMALRRRLWEELGGFDESLGPVYFVDLDFFVRALLHAPSTRVYTWAGVFVHHYWHSTLYDRGGDAPLDSAWRRYARKWEGNADAVGALNLLQAHHLLQEYELVPKRR